jgi:hypothetical protein
VSYAGFVFFVAHRHHDLGHHAAEFDRLDDALKLVARTEHSMSSRVE